MMLSGLRRLKCRRIRPALWDYVAERLSEGPLETVERHLAVCAICRRETESLRHAQGLLAACRQAPLPPPRSDWSALRSRLLLEGPLPADADDQRAHRPRAVVRRMSYHLPRRRNRWLPSLTVSTACATLLLLAAFGYRSLHPAVPERKDAGTDYLAAEQDAAATHNAAVSDPDPFHFGDRATANAGFGMIDLDGASRIGMPPLRGASVHTVSASGRHPELLHRSASPSGHGRETPIIAGIGSHVRQSHAKEAGASKQNAPHFRHYTPRPEDALPQNGAEESRYAIDSVAPVGGAGSGTYVMSSVRPAQYNTNAPY